MVSDELDEKKKSSNRVSRSPKKDREIKGTRHMLNVVVGQRTRAKRK